jgi:hypothetical protein
MENLVESMPGMEATMNHIGKELFYNEAEFNRINGFVNTHVLPKLELIKSEYNRLDIGTFDQSIFTELMSIGVRDIEKAYIFALEADSKAAYKVASFAKHMVDYVKSTSPMKSLEEMIIIAKKAIDDYNALGQGQRLIRITDIIYVDDEFQLQIEIIRKDLKKTIDTQDKADLYQSMIEFKDAAQKYQGILEKLWGDRPYVKLGPTHVIQYGSSVHRLNQVMVPVAGKWELNEEFLKNLF